MLVHVPILAHGDARRVAIVGGGDGGALEEVLKHDVERVVMIELDPGVVELSRRFLPSICGDAFDDPRAEVIFQDGTAYMKSADEVFDVIIVDSTDPVGPSVALFEHPFYADCRARLGENGILVTQSGVTFMQEEEARDTYARMKPLFADAWLYLTQVPTYGAGFMTLGWGSRSTAPRATPLEEIERPVPRRRHRDPLLQPRGPCRGFRAAHIHPRPDGLSARPSIRGFAATQGEGVLELSLIPSRREAPYRGTPHPAVPLSRAAAAARPSRNRRSILLVPESGSASTKNTRRGWP